VSQVGNLRRSAAAREMAEYLAMLTEDNLRAGMPPAEARRQVGLRPSAEYAPCDRMLQKISANHSPTAVESCPTSVSFGQNENVPVCQDLDSIQWRFVMVCA
jgi:hypothetical protein